jgi:hypothetical protein
MEFLFLFLSVPSVVVNPIALHPLIYGVQVSRVGGNCIGT